MRSIFILIAVLILQIAFAQTPSSNKKLRESCTWLETIVTAAIKNFSTEKRELLRSYKEDYEMGGIYYFEEYSTTFLWPGTVENFIRVSTSDIEDEQTISLISRYQKTDTKEKGYAQLKKLYTELTPCTITPLPNQQVSTKNNLLPITKVLGSGVMPIMQKTFDLAGVKRKVNVRLGLREENKKYYTEMEVSLELRDEEVIVPKCQALSDVIRQLSANFSGNYDNVIFSEDLPIANGVSTSTKRYKAKKWFPGISGAWIENSKIKKNGAVKRDSWSMKSWYSSISYETALSMYKKVYRQLLGCTIVTPAGRQIQLKGDYSEPATMLSGNKRGIIDFKTSTESEQFFVGITLEKEDNGYFVWLSVAGAKKF